MSANFYERLQHSNSAIYFTQDQKEKIIDFKFKDFKLPNNFLDWIFFSVSKTSKGQYRVRVMFFFDDKEIREIITSKKREIILSKIPSKIIDI